MSRAIREGDRVVSDRGPGRVDRIDVVRWFNRIRLREERQAIAWLALDDGARTSRPLRALRHEQEGTDD